MPGLVPSEQILTVEGTPTTWDITGKGSWLVVLLMPSKVLVASVSLAAILAMVDTLTFGSFAHPTGLGELDVAAA